jgi:DNA-binding beta-propeller fold protein YncE
MKQSKKVLIPCLVTGLFFAGMINTWGGEKPSTVADPFPVKNAVALPFPPTQIAISDQDSMAYILSPPTDTTSYLAQVDTKIRQLIDISPLNAKVTNLLLNAGGDKLYLTTLPPSENQPPQVLILDVHQNKVTTKIPLPLSSSPGSMVLSPDQRTLYVIVRPIHDPNTDRDYAGVLAINLSTEEIAYAIPLTTEAGTALTITPDGTQVYMSTGSVGGAAGFDTKTHEILFPQGILPHSYEFPPQLAMSSEGNFLYLAGVESSLFRASITLADLSGTHNDNQPFKQLTFPALGTPLLQLSRDSNIAYLIDDEPMAGKGNEIHAVNIKTGDIGVIPVTDNSNAVNIKGITLSADGTMIYLIGVRQQGDTLSGVVKFVPLT